MNKSTHARNVQCNAITGLINQGTGTPSGSLRIFTSDSTLITSLHLSNPAFADSTDSTAVAYQIYDATNLVTGTASIYGFYDRDSSFIWGGTVSTIGGGGELQINSTSLVEDSTTSIFPAYYAVQ